VSIPQVRYQRSPATLARTVGDDVLLAAAGQEEMELLSGTAGAVWRLLSTPRTRDDISRRLARDFAALPERVEADVERLLQHLEHRGWIEEISRGRA